MNSEMNRRRTFRGLAFAAVACPLMLLAGTAHATPLGLNSSYPDITSGGILVEYDASGTYGHFTAVGTNFEYFESDVTSHAISGGTFTIDMLVDKSDGSPVSGSLLMTGSTSTGSPTYSSPLLTSSYIKKFGFEDSPGGEIFEWMFTPDGGTMATLFPFAGIILNAEDTGFTGSWTTSFTNEVFGGFGFGSADTYAMVPEPSTGLLMLGALGIAVIGRRVYRRRRASSKSESPPATATATG